MAEDDAFATARASANSPCCNFRAASFSANSSDPNAFWLRCECGCRGFWVSCPRCNQPTAGTSLFCIHHSHLVAFTPRLWLTGALIFAPATIALALTFWPTPSLVYSILAVAIWMYGFVAFRRLPNRRAVVACWTALGFLLVEGYALLPAMRPVVVNATVGIYILLFLILLFERSVRNIRSRHGHFAVAFSAVLSLFTISSFAVECSLIPPYFGFESQVWLVERYRHWFFWIWTARAVLVVLSFSALAVKASTDISSVGVTKIENANGPLSIIFLQLKHVADVTYAWWKVFWSLLRDSLSLSARLALRFAIEEIAPATFAFIAAVATLSFSIDLYDYGTTNGMSPLALCRAGILVIVLFFVFEYLELTAEGRFLHDKWPPVFRLRFPFWTGAATDVRMLFQHLLYVIPLTSLLLYLIHLIADHFGVQTLSPGFGTFSLLFLAILLTMGTWGYFRSKV